MRTAIDDSSKIIYRNDTPRKMRGKQRGRSKANNQQGDSSSRSRSSSSSSSGGLSISAGGNKGGGNRGGSNSIATRSEAGSRSEDEVGARYHVLEGIPKSLMADMIYSERRSQVQRMGRLVYAACYCLLC